MLSGKNKHATAWRFFWRKSTGEARPPLVTLCKAEARSDKEMAGALNLHTFDQTSEVAHILTVLRDKCTDLRDFVFYADRLTRLLVEKSLSLLEYEKKTVMTSTGN